MSDLIRSFGELIAEQRERAGGKGASLARLFRAGFPVPDGFVIPPQAFVGGTLSTETWEQVRASLARLRAADASVAFAVRSSAMSEDSAQASFAGEFESVLNVRTDKEVHEAIHAVYRSRHNERVQAYSEARGLDAAHKVAVVVQRLVPAECSGVLFTANPVTGHRDQAVINASWGLGEAIVGGVVTPDSLIVDKATGGVLSRETADKRVMTVLAGSGTQARSVPKTRRRAPVLSDAQAAELVRLGTQVEAFFGMPVDIEWTLSEGHFAIVQARPITALPAPELAVPTEWKLPAGAYMAVRNNIVELMVDPLTPLFRTLGLAAVNASMRRLLSDAFGGPQLVPEQLIISVNQYAYYGASWSPGQLARILLHSVGIMRRMFTGAVERWMDDARPAYVATVQRWQHGHWQHSSTGEILNAVKDLARAAIDAYGALVSGVIPAAWISEGLFTLTYNALIKRRGDPPAPTFLLGFDSAPFRAEQSLFDLATWARGRVELAAYLDETPTAQIVAQATHDGSPLGVCADDWREWRRRLRTHLKHYGHMIYNLDFASPVPADDPAPLIETLRLFIRDEGSDPYARQEATVERRRRATESIESRLRGLRLSLFRKTLATAQRYAPLREDGLADVGLSYPLLRQMLREVGRRLTRAGTIEQPDDVFWLTQDDVERLAAALDQGEPCPNLAQVIPQHRAAWRAAGCAAPPLSLPQIRVLGLNITELKSRMRRRNMGNLLKGVPASPGRVTAPACVIHGPEGFGRMRAGDVLVATLTTPAWTPLFARAAAVVTDVGGPLSHGSIVAREYGIPAVLGTGTATKRIQNEQIVTVDGSAGTVTLVQRNLREPSC